MLNGWDNGSISWMMCFARFPSLNISYKKRKMSAWDQPRSQGFFSPRRRTRKGERRSPGNEVALGTSLSNWVTKKDESKMIMSEWNENDIWAYGFDYFFYLFVKVRMSRSFLYKLLQIYILVKLSVHFFGKHWVILCYKKIIIWFLNIYRMAVLLHCHRHYVLLSSMEV